MNGDLFDAGGTRLSDQFAEMQLLGILLEKPQYLDDVLRILGNEAFFDPLHRRIFATLETAANRGDEITPSNLVHWLGLDIKAPLLNGVTIGGYIAQLAADAEIDIDVEQTAEHIADCAERRAIGAADDVYEPFKSRFGGQRWSEIGAAGSPTYEYVIEDLIPKGEAVLIFGDSGTGKSFQTFDMGMCIARGLPFYGRNVEPGLVVYVAAEAGKGFAKRKLAYCMHHKLGDADLPFYLMTKRIDFFNAETDCDAIIAEIAQVRKLYKLPLALIVFDTLAAMTPGMNEIASADVTRVRARLQRVIDAFGAATAVVHHKPKGGSTPRGHGSLTGDFEVTIELLTTELKSPETLPIHRAINIKQREGKKGMTWEFTLPVIEVGRNKWGNPETSCVVVPWTIKRTSLQGFHATPNEMLFLHALFEALDERAVAAPADLPRSVTKAVDIDEVRQRMRSRYIATDDDPQKAETRFRQVFKRAGDALKTGAVIGFRKPLFWYTGKPVKGFNAMPQADQSEGA